MGFAIAFLASFGIYVLGLAALMWLAYREVNWEEE